MYPYIVVNNVTIPTYWLCGLLGLSLCIFFEIFNHKNFLEVYQVDITNCAALGIVGMILGARILYLITLLPIVIKYWNGLMANKDLLWELLYTGMVFYGGLIGFIVAINLYLKKYRLNYGLFWDYLTPCIPLFHAFGRVGCFFTGCCYGKPRQQFGMVFSNSISCPTDVALFPLQLFGAAGEFLLFFATALYEKKHHKEGKTLFFYLIIYTVGRFFYEFLRGDDIRGIWLGLSTSQWISLFLTVFIIILTNRNKSAAQ